jgi:tape measure domain-containing protein
MRKAESEYQHAVKQLENALRKGRISREEYNRELARERLAVEKARGAQQRYERAIERQTQAVNKNTQAKIRNNRTGSLAGGRGRGWGGDLANAGGNLASALGAGGAVAGGARMAGLATGGPMLALAGAAGLGALTLQKSYKAYAKFEDQLIRLKVLFGKGLGETLNEEFRDLALNTALSRDAITEAAIVWRSYGLSTEDITERVRRMGEVSGGSAERMKLLATALAQVNSVGRLMGGERLQLLNAGFNLQEVAKAAGIQMSEFKQAMEEGRISAEHVNQALVAMTSKGGTHFGYLNEKAKTLNGRMEKLSESINELFIGMGEADSGFFSDSITWAEGFTEQLRSAAMYWGWITNNHPTGEISRVGPNGEGYAGPGRAGQVWNERTAAGGIPGVGYDTTIRYSDSEMGPSMILGALANWTGITAPNSWASQERNAQASLGMRYEGLRQRDSWKEDEAQADAKRGTPEYKLYYEAQSRAAYRQKQEMERRRANSRGFTFGDIGSGAAYAWNQSVNTMDPDVNPLGAMMGAGLQVGQWASGAAQWGRDAAANNSVGWGDAQALNKMARTEAAQEKLLDMMGLGRDKTPPAIKKIMEERSAAIAELDEQARKRQLGKSLSSGGSAGAGQEYEYLAKQRKVERQYEEQKKRDKERNDKLEDIDEKARVALESQLATDRALMRHIENSGSI